MKKVAHLVFIISLVQVLSGSVSAQNLLQNGNFQQLNQHWIHLSQNGAVSTHAVTDSGRTTGDTCLRFSVYQLGSNAYDVQSIHDVWNATTGSPYRVTLWAKANANGRKIRIIAQDTAYLNSDLTLTNTWQQYTWDFTSPENGLYFKIHWFEAGTFMVQDIAITKILPAPIPSYPDSLQHYANRINLNIGAALFPSGLVYEPAYRKIYNQQFNAMVPENAMKMPDLWPNEAAGIQWKDADTLVNFAMRNGKKIRGHNLLWYQGIPGWFAAKTWQPDTMRKFLKNYVHTVVGRYKGKIYEWDVVNEIIEDAGVNFRSFIVTNTLGNSIVDSMFVWAHQADSNAILVYNDYAIETGGTKFNTVFSMVQSMKQRGIPIHGVGFQCHFGNNSGSGFYSSIENTVRQIAALGVKVSFTEIDMALDKPIQQPDYVSQGSCYAQMLRIVLRNRPIMNTFMMWGFTDKHSWIPQYFTNRDETLPIDRNYYPKPAYDSLLAVLKTVVPITGNAKDISKEILQAWPNPSSDGFMLTGLTPGQTYKIVDITGQIREQGIFSIGQKVGEDLSTSGTYIILAGDGRKKVMLVKE